MDRSYRIENQSHTKDSGNLFGHNLNKNYFLPEITPEKQYQQPMKTKYHIQENYDLANSIKEIDQKKANI